MGALTEDMGRLRREVESLRSERGALMQDLARRTDERHDAVNTMQACFATAHADMAKHARGERQAFVGRHKRAVAQLRREFATDRAGAHRAWFGKGA